MLASIADMELGTPYVVAAPAHPSLDDAIRRFCAALRHETRYFGRRGAASPKPSPSLVRRLESADPALQLAAIRDGEIIGLARIDERVADSPELLIAVAEPWRRRGVALSLAQDVVAKAHEAGIGRIVLRACHRQSELRELGTTLGFQAFDLGRGRLDLVRTLPPISRSA